MSNKLPYTVIAVVDGTGEIKHFLIEAEDDLNAFAVVAEDNKNGPYPLDFVVALKGHLSEDHGLIFPGEALVSSLTVLEQPDVFGSGKTAPSAEKP